MYVDGDYPNIIISCYFRRLFAHILFRASHDDIRSISQALLPYVRFKRSQLAEYHQNTSVVEVAL